jgi:galactose mutarotase-like enzyme
MADSTGAELKSIKKAGDKESIEYLWQLNPEIWERQAPLLFPVIGRLKDGEYTHEGCTYNIDIHGFARFSEFNAVLKSDSEVSFILKSDEKTMKEYPFEFKLTVNYKLNGNEIIKSHIVENTGGEIMPYEIGGHEGYNLSLFEDETMEDYFIEFPGMDEISTYTADENIMINKKKKIIPLKNNRIYLFPEVFKDDALILDEFPERVVKLRNDKNKRGVDVEFEDFNYLGLWTKYMRTDYVCIEPWSSLPDCNYLGKELMEKKDIRILQPGTKDKLTYTIRVI